MSIELATNRQKEVRSTHARNGQVIKGHTMKPRVCLLLFVPPAKWESCGFRWSAEVKLEFVEQGLGLQRFLEGWKVVEDVLRFR